MKRTLFILASMISFSFSGQAYARLSCAGIFTLKLSKEAIERKVHSMAELKVQIDLAKINPHLLPESLLRKILDDYRETYGSLLLSSGLSEIDFSNKIKKQIVKIQRIQTKETDTEHKVRKQEVERELNREVLLKVKKSTPLGKKWKSDYYSFGTLSKDGTLFYLDRSIAGQPFLKTFNIKTLKHESFFPEPVVLADTVANGTQIAFLDRTWTLRVFDIASRSLVREVKLDTKGMIFRSDFEDFAGIDISPSGERVVISGNAVAAFDMNNGAVLGQTNSTYGSFAGYTRYVRFTSENDFAFASDHYIFKFDLVSGERTHAQLNQTSALQGFDVSFDGTLINIKTVSKFMVVDPNNLSILNSMELRGQIGEFRRVPGYLDYIFFNFTSQNYPRIYSQATGKEVFDFGNAYDFDTFFGETLSSHFTPDGRKMMIITNEDGVYTMHTWEQ